MIFIKPLRLQQRNKRIRKQHHKDGFYKRMMKRNQRQDTRKRMERGSNHTYQHHFNTSNRRETEWAHPYKVNKNRPQNRHYMNHSIKSGETASAKCTSRIHQARSPSSSWETVSTKSTNRQHHPRSPSSSSWETASATSTSRNSTPARRQHSAGKPYSTPSDSESIKEYRDREIERFRKQVQERKELIRQRDNGEITKETYTLTKSLQAQSYINNQSSSSLQSSRSKQEKISRTICNTTKNLETGRPRSTSPHHLLGV